MTHTFTVNDHEVVEHLRKYRPESAHFLEHKEVAAKVRGNNIYASPVQTVGGNSPFFTALSYAFNNHCPLIVTPDNVWMTILMGLCHHVDSDPEGLRHHFVQHEGKKELVVRVLSPMGAAQGLVPREVWDEGIDKFSDQLREHLGKRHDLIVANFSTTTDVDRTSSMLMLMGAMKHYFSYKMMLLCGLSRVTVEGTTKDWDDIIERVHALDEFGLEWWTEHLTPILEEIRSTCAGNPDVELWKAAYLAHRVGSGSQSRVSGWINSFFPYVSGGKRIVRNPYVNWKNNERGAGLDTDDFPFGMARVPVLVDDHGRELRCEFYGGLVGVSMDEDFTVRAVSGIAIQHLKNED